MGSTNVDAARTFVGAGSVAFGVLSMLGPGTLRRAYGDTTSSGGALDYFGRTWGTRTAALGAIMLTASSDAERARLARIAAVMNAADSVAGLTAHRLSRPTRMMAGLTSAGFAAASFYVARNL